MSLTLRPFYGVHFPSEHRPRFPELFAERAAGVIDRTGRNPFAVDFRLRASGSFDDVFEVIHCFRVIGDSKKGETRRES